MCDVGNWIFSKSWEFFGNSVACGNSLGILWEFVKVTGFLHFESQLLTKRYFNMEGINLFSLSTFCLLSRFWLKERKGGRQEKEGHIGRIMHKTTLSINTCKKEVNASL